MNMRRAAAGSCLLWAVGCAGAQPSSERAAGLTAGARLADLPAGYALVIGKVLVTMGGEPLACTTTQLRAPCGLSIRYQTGETFLVPQQGTPGSLSTLTAPDPFFAVRLPRGSYEVTRFEAPPEALREGAPAPLDRTIALRKRFSVHAGEMLYVGSLYVDLAAGAGRRVSVRVLDETQQAAAVAREIDPGASPGLTVRLME